MKRIMVLEDDTIILSGIVYALKNEGYETVSCGTVADAQKKAENMQIDLGILDMQLPDGNGRSVSRCLKEKGVPCEWKKYGEEGQNYMAHVFHVNMNLEEAKQCNQDEIAFFRKYEVK